MKQQKQTVKKVCCCLLKSVFSLWIIDNREHAESFGLWLWTRVWIIMNEHQFIFIGHKILCILDQFTELFVGYITHRQAF